MALKKNLSDKGIRFIARFEGFRSGLYNDAAGNCTIGYGHLNQGPWSASRSTSEPET